MIVSVLIIRPFKMAWRFRRVLSIDIICKARKRQRCDMTNFSLAKGEFKAIWEGMICKPVKICLALVLISSAASASFAQTKDGKRGEIYCFPAKDVPKLVEGINSVDEKRRNIVNVTIDPKFLIKDGGVWPDAFYLARDGEIVTDMPFSREDGRVPTFIEAVNSAPDTDICVVDPTRADKPEDDEGLYFEMGLSPIFITATGEHNMADIKEGSRDAKRFYKQMIPSVFRMFMPDTDYLAVKYLDPKYVLPDARPQIFARVDGKDIALEYERHKEMFVVSGDDLKNMDASALVVRGGAYDLQPVPSPSVMRRFGWGGDDDIERAGLEAETVTGDNSAYSLGDK